MQMQITKNHYASAHNSLALINAAIAAISALSLEALNGDELLRRQLDELCRDLEETKVDHREIIAAGDALKNSLDPQIVSRCLERVHALNNDLTWKNGELLRKKQAYADRLREALTARVPVEHFRPLDVPPTPEDEIRIAQERALIELELKRIHAFLGTVPLCDFTFLIGTQLEQFIPGASA